MIEAGDVYLADLNAEQRLRVLVVSSGRFNELSGRAIVAPEIAAVPGEPLAPWRVRHADSLFAIDFLRSLPLTRLLERTDRLPHRIVESVRRAMAHIV